MKKRLLALVLALLPVLLLSVACKKDEPLEDDLPQEEIQTPDYYDAGTVEGSLTWEIHSDGTLYVKGTGAMSDLITSAEQGENQQPWATYSAAIKRVVVEDGVTRLSQLSFKRCTNLTEVVLGRGITSIPTECFANCYALKKIEAKGVTVLEECALENCLRLEVLTVSASLERVEQGALGGSCTEGAGLTLKLAGTAAELEQARVVLRLADPEHSEKVLADAMENVSFVEK